MGNPTRIRVYSAVKKLERYEARAQAANDDAALLERRTRAYFVRVLRQFAAPRCVYVVQLERWVKIGTTESLRGRLAELQTACPLKLRLLMAFPGGVNTERALHRRFASQRCSGEWFTYNDEVRAWVEALRRMAREAPVTRGTALRAAGYRVSEP